MKRVEISYNLPCKSVENILQFAVHISAAATMRSLIFMMCVLLFLITYNNKVNYEVNCVHVQFTVNYFMALAVVWLY